MSSKENNTSSNNTGTIIEEKIEVKKPSFYQVLITTLCIRNLYPTVIMTRGTYLEAARIITGEYDLSYIVH